MRLTIIFDKFRSEWRSSYILSHYTRNSSRQAIKKSIFNVKTFKQLYGPDVHRYVQFKDCNGIFLGTNETSLVYWILDARQLPGLQQSCTFFHTGIINSDSSMVERLLFELFNGISYYS